jgi:hypothetical protein
MLRFRSKQWESSWNVDLPVSASSSSSESLSDKPDIPFTHQRGSGYFYQTQRFVKIILILLAFVLSLLFLYSVSLLRTSTGRSVQSHASEPHLNTTRDIPSKSKKLPHGKPPLVERSILDKLTLLDQSADDPDERRYYFSTTTTPAWPPVVTRIPEAHVPNLASNSLQHQFQHEPISKASPTEFDYSICGAETCRFILPLRIAEQESKARLHFLQILELAGQLNRIVVLPNVGKSRMGSCFKWNFEKYYDTAELSSGGHMRVIDMETFRRWTATRPIKPSSQIISIESKPLTGPSSGPSLFSENGITVKIEHDQDPSDPKHVRCLKSKFPRLGLRAFSPLSIHPSKWVKQRSFGPAVVDALEREHIRSASFRVMEDKGLDTVDSQQQDNDQDVDVGASSTDSDVLILNYDLRHPIFPTSQTLSYSPVLSAFATSLLAPLKPNGYLVVHWRMETVPPDVLSSCAEALISILTGLLQGQGDETIKTVWFASDYPYPVSHPSHHRSTQKDGGSKSGTFRAVGPQHEEAIDILRNAFNEGGPLEGRRITGLAEELARVRAAARNAKTGIGIEVELLEDSGVLGILDKLVAMQAGLFVSGGKACGRVRYVESLYFHLATRLTICSSFTKQIVEARDAVMTTEEREIRNVVKYFG